MATPLLSTKLFISPRRPRDSVVDRSRLTDRLAATNGQRLALISAPAGFGKTTLPSEWISRSEHCVPWLSLDTSSNDGWIMAKAMLETRGRRAGCWQVCNLMSKTSFRDRYRA